MTPKMQSLSKQLRYTALMLLSMYLGILGLFALHLHHDDSHNTELIKPCAVEEHSHSLHYHQATEDCSLPTHILSLSPLVAPLSLGLPKVEARCLDYAVYQESVSLASVYLYHLRAPPVGISQLG